jgi:UDPglucose 6-dehydrogenase
MKTLIDCLAILTEWPEFKFPNKNCSKLLSTPANFDGRNIYDREMKESGFDYFCIGIDTKKIK